MTKHLKRILITIIFAELLHSPALALNNEEVFSQFQFNFITPGARATALGGAFIGLADDATAAATNPAGLTILTEPEFSGEFKYLGYTTEQIYENHSFETEITRKEFDDVVLSAPFVSLVLPHKRFVASIYRQEVVNYKSSFRTGASLGVSPGWSDMTMKSHIIRFEPSPWSLSGPTDFSDDEIYSKDRIEDSDSGFSINAGILWGLHPKLSIGAMYRSGTTFTVKEWYYSIGDIADKRKQFSFSMVYRFSREKTRIPKKKSDLTRAAVLTLTEKALPSVTFMVVERRCKYGYSQYLQKSVFYDLYFDCLHFCFPRFRCKMV